MGKSKKEKREYNAVNSSDRNKGKRKFSGCYFVSISVFTVISGVLFAYLRPYDLLQTYYLNRNLSNIPSTKGEWRFPDQKDLEIYQTSQCDIDRHYADEISLEKFQSIYRYKKPLILRFRNGASDWTDPSKWTLGSLKAAYGQWSVMSGSSRDIVRRGGSGDIDTSFSKFLEKMMSNQSETEPQYLFDREFYNSSGLPQTLHPPQYLAIKDSLDDSIFFLGSSGSGVSFHQHADAWNGVVYGRKRWFLYPIQTTPPGGVYPGFTQLEWYNSIYPNLNESSKPMECVQQAGEILYLPESFYHGTINIGDTIAVGIQKKLSATDIGRLYYEVGELEKKSQTSEVKIRIKDIFTELLELLPGNAEIWMKLGSAYYSLGDYEKAVPLLEEAVNKDPYFILAWLELAKVHEQLGDVPETERCYKRATIENTTLWDVYAFRGDFLLRQGRPAEAAQMYKQGLLLKPEMLTFWKMLKLAQEQLGDVKGATFSQDWIDLLSLTG